MDSKSRKKDAEHDVSKEIPKDFAYDAEKGSYELDVNDQDPDWDHPADYDTLSEGAKDDLSTYDNSNPNVGDEYGDRDELIEEEYKDAGIHVIKDKDLKISSIDEELAKTEEDYRDDLDEEGYPKKD